MIENLNTLIKEAMKAKDKVRLDALRYLKSMLMENKVSKSPKEEMAVVISHHKKLSDSIEMYPEGSDQRNAIINEVSIISEFMPKPLSESEVIKIINEIKSNLESPNMGAIMKDLSPKIKGKFDGKKASALVQQALKS